MPVIRETIRSLDMVVIGRLVLTGREHIIAWEPLADIPRVPTIDTLSGYGEAADWGVANNLLNNGTCCALATGSDARQVRCRYRIAKVMSKNSQSCAGVRKLDESRLHWMTIDRGRLKGQVMARQTLRHKHYFGCPECFKQDTETSAEPLKPSSRRFKPLPAKPLFFESGMDDLDVSSQPAPRNNHRGRRLTAGCFDNTFRLVFEMRGLFC